MLNRQSAVKLSRQPLAESINLDHISRFVKLQRVTARAHPWGHNQCWGLFLKFIRSNQAAVSGAPGLTHFHNF